MILNVLVPAALVAGCRAAQAPEEGLLSFFLRFGRCFGFFFLIKKRSTPPRFHQTPITHCS